MDFYSISPVLTSNRLTWVIWNWQPLDVTKPCSFNRSAISDNDLPCVDSDRSKAIARILLGLLSAFALLVLELLAIASWCLHIRFSALPNWIPLAFLACNDCLVLWLISPALYSAMLLMICRINLLACGKSQKTISTSDSSNLDVNATFLDNLSRLATWYYLPLNSYKCYIIRLFLSYGYLVLYLRDSFSWSLGSWLVSIILMVNGGVAPMPVQILILLLAGMRGCWLVVG